MSRYTRLYLYFLRFSFSKSLEFRFDFTFRIFMDTIYYLINIAFFKVIFLHTNLLGGWTEKQMMVFVAGYLLVDAINMTIFSTNMWWLPYFINRGELDYYLIRPVSPLFFLGLREFSVNSFVNFLMALTFCGYAIWDLGEGLSFLNIFFFGLLLLNGSLIYFCIQMLMIIPVFWTHSARGFVDLFYAMGQAMERPDRVYRGWMKIVFTTILPFALIASFPAKIFLDPFDAKTMAHLFIMTVILWSTMLFFWRKGLANYSSASS